MRPAGSSISRVQRSPLGKVITRVCRPGSRSMGRYSVLVSPYDLPSTAIGKPPGVVRILIVPYLAFFGLLAKAVEEECAAQKVSANKAAKANLPYLRNLLDACLDFDIGSAFLRLDLKC